MKKSLFPEMFQVPQITLNYRNPTPFQERITVDKPSVAYVIFRATWDYDIIDFVEQFKIILLDQASKCLGIANLTSGTVNSCPLDARIVFAPALIANATAIVLAHNHPSGSLNPSPLDKEVTQRIVEWAKLLDIMVMDHIILTRDGYFSFIENKILPL